MVFSENRPNSRNNFVFFYKVGPFLAILDKVSKNKEQMGYFEEIQEAKSFIQDRFNATPRIGVVLGSGLGAFAESFADATTISYSDIPHFAQSGVVGHAGELVLGELDDVTCAVMSGRVHFYEGFDMQKVTFPMEKKI